MTSLRLSDHFSALAPNYDAILKWIKNGPQTLPPSLRAGRVLYYDSIPDTIPMNWQTGLIGSTATVNDRFWKEYIDFVIGVWRDPTATIQHPGSSTCSYGPDFAAGDGTGVSITGPDSSTKYNNIAFVAATDNPLRPRHRRWFGPMTMIQYILDTGITPGTTHDVSMVVAKLGINGAITDIQNNHPNDMVSMITTHVKKGARLRIGGLGILQVRKRPARMGRNPATGAAIKIKASKKVAFRAAKELKESV